MDSRDKPSRSRQAVAEAAPALLRRLPAYVYLSDLWDGRRVLEVGCGDGASAAYLARSGAAQVVGLDRASQTIDLARARQRGANLSFGVGDYAALDLDDQSVDVICVPAGAELARWPAFLDEARRVLTRDGCLILSVPSADRPGGGSGLSYHDLLGRLAPVFGDVRMIGITPFVGFALVEYAESQVLEVELDTSLAAEGARELVTDYVAVAGSSLGDPRGFMVVELPTPDGMRTVGQARGMPLGDRSTVELGERLAAAEATAAEALARLAELETAGPRTSRAEEGELRRRLNRAIEDRAAIEVETQSLRARLSQADEEIGRVAAQAAREVAEARRQVQLAAGRAESVEAQIAAALEEKRTLERRVDELQTRSSDPTQVELMARAAAQHEAEMRARAMELSERDAYVDELRQEIEEVAAAERAAAEAARDASVRVTELEAEVREMRARVAAAEGESLRLRGGGAPPASAGVATDPRLVDLEQTLAEKTAAADKATARWKEAEGKSDELWRKIGELQKELAATREQAVETARQQRQAAQIALTRAVDEASKKLVSAQDQTGRTEKERRELEKEVGALRARLADAERDHGEATARAGGEVEAARQRIAFLEVELAKPRTDPAVIELRTELDRERSDRLRLEDELVEARRADPANVLELLGEALQKEEEDLRARLAAQPEEAPSAALSQHAAALADARRRLAELQESLQAARRSGAGEEVRAALDELSGRPV